MIGWLDNYWTYLIVSLFTFIAIVVIGLWARFVIHNILRQQKQRWAGTEFLIKAMWHPFLHWFLLLGAYAAIEISILSHDVKILAGDGIASLFVLSFIWTTISLSAGLIRFYLGKTERTQLSISIILNIVRISIIIIGIIVIFGIWGAPTLPIIIVLGAILFLVGVIFRNNFDNLLAGFEIAYGEHIKVGHLIKLGSGEIGNVIQISWMRTKIKNTEGNLVTIPNSKIMSTTIVKYDVNATENTPIGIQQEALTTIEQIKPVGTLSDREKEVLRLIGTGATNREIAEKLIISEHTVKTHLRSILNKLNVRNRQQAAVYAERVGLIVKIDALKNNP